MVERVKFTIKVLKSLEVPEGKSEATIYDSEQPGLLARKQYGDSCTYELRRKVNGKAVRVRLGSFPELKIEQARKLARQQLEVIGEGKNPNAKKRADRARNTTLSQCLEDYLASRSLRDNTLKSYRYSIDECLKHWRNKRMLDITRDMVEKKHKALTIKSPTRANTTMRVLRALFNYAQEHYDDEQGNPIVVVNPVRRLSTVKAWAPESARTSMIHSTDLPAWFEAVESMTEWLRGYNTNPEVARDYLLFILFTGLRRREAANIEKTWVDTRNAILTIPSTHTKNKHEHRIPLSDYLLDISKRRIREDSEYLFTYTDIKPIQEPKKFVNQVRERSGVHFTLHDLRRTFITTAEGVDVRDFALKRLLNHRMDRDMSDRYIVTDVDRLRQPMQTITDRLLLLAKNTNSKNVILLPNK